MGKIIAYIRQGLRYYSIRLSFVPAMAAAIAMIDPGTLIAVYALLPIDPITRAVLAVASFLLVICSVWAVRFWPQDIAITKGKPDGSL